MSEEVQIDETTLTDANRVLANAFGRMTFHLDGEHGINLICNAKALTKDMEVRHKVPIGPYKAIKKTTVTADQLYGVPDRADGTKEQIGLVEFSQSIVEFAHDVAVWVKGWREGHIIERMAQVDHVRREILKQVEVACLSPAAVRGIKAIISEARRKILSAAEWGKLLADDGWEGVNAEIGFENLIFEQIIENHPGRADLTDNAMLGHLSIILDAIGFWPPKKRKKPGATDALGVIYRRLKMRNLPKKDDPEIALGEEEEPVPSLHMQKVQKHPK